MNRTVEQKDGYRVIKRGDVKIKTVSLDCRLCECVIFDELDEISISRSDCCYECEIEVADPNRERWLQGWRPAGIELDEIRLRRLSSPHSRVHI
jgi:hypothetical protein